MPLRKRIALMMDRDLLVRLEAIQARTGLSMSEQIREGVRWWIAARQWPDDPTDDTSGEPAETDDSDLT